MKKSLLLVVQAMAMMVDKSCPKNAQTERMCRKVSEVFNPCASTKITLMSTKWSQFAP